jgi:aspartate carbamoyltransferase catalytic subunit
MTSDRLTRARPDLLILAPGPINRGVEMTAEVADCRQSLILDQVTNGLAVRMGVLWLTCGPRADHATVHTDATTGLPTNHPANQPTRSH